jgi:hypothetical protein
MGSMRSRVAGFFRSQKKRALPRRSVKPPIGARVARGDLRLTVQAGMSHELWYWLLGEGWRELTYRPDRRRYRDLPPAWVTWLIDAAPEFRGEVLAAGIEKATHRTGPTDLERFRPPARRL